MTILFYHRTQKIRIVQIIRIECNLLYFNISITLSCISTYIKMQE